MFHVRSLVVLVRIPQRSLTTIPLVTQGKYDKAEPMYRRAQKVFEASLGRDNANVATVLINRAVLLIRQVRAVRFFLRQFRIVHIRRLALYNQP